MNEIEVMKALDLCRKQECGECHYVDTPKCVTKLLYDARTCIANLQLSAGSAVLQSVKPLRYWAEEIHANAVEHGWWDEDRTFWEVVALCHSELSEALEEYRAGKPMEYASASPDDPDEKPEGIAVEMIDCLIRILDWCGKEGVDVDEILARKHAYNKTRPYRHGGKKL